MRKLSLIFTILLSFIFAAEVSLADKVWLSGAGITDPNPIILNQENNVYVIYLQDGEVFSRQYKSGKWDEPLQVSSGTNNKLNTQAGACQDVRAQVIQDTIHAVWTNNGQLLYRGRDAKGWRGSISILANNYARSAEYPEIRALTAGGKEVLISYIHDGQLVSNVYNADTNKWMPTLRQPIPSKNITIPPPIQPAGRENLPPPEPPAWVKIWPQGVGIETPEGETKIGNKRQIAITWTDGNSEAGIRYHTLGRHAKWWLNDVHQSGDIVEADEGWNTFYVFAVDNEGNASVPGTDTIFIKSVLPDAPVLNNTVTSANYFYGTCGADAITILVNGQPVAEITSTGNWRYEHGLSTERKQKISFQAVDIAGNKSSAAEYTVAVDQTSPKIIYAEHNAVDKTLRIKDTLTITARGESDCQAFFSIEGVTENIPLIEEKNGSYTGSYIFDSEEMQGQAEVSVAFFDKAGNSATQKTLQPLSVDSWAEQLVDNFEERGDLYPWKNFLKARNIRTADEKDDVDAPEGQGILRVEYNLNGRQNWAGLTSREFLPRNYYGSQPSLQFWLKGSGSEARLIVQLLNKQSKIGLYDYNNDYSYSVPLNDTQWKKYSLILPNIEGLDQTVKYAIYVYNPDNTDAGVFYLDDLSVIYQRPFGTKTQPIGKSAVGGNSVTLPLARVSASAVATESAALSPGGAFLAPYLDLELTPAVLTRGNKQAIKVQIPEEMDVAQVYVIWGRINQKLQTTKLNSVGGNIFKGEYSVPVNLQDGEQPGDVFVQTADKQLYKKPFYYRVLRQSVGANSTEQINAQFFPHPLVSGKDIRVRVNVPVAVQSQQVMIFLGQDQSEVFSATLSKDKTLSADGQEIWQGVFVLPENTMPGEYNANIFVKTNNGSFIKKKIKYSVQE